MRFPKVQEFTSALIIDRFDDMITPPALTNHWAVMQVDHDVVAVRSLSVPPVSQGDEVSGRLYLQGRLAQSYGQPVKIVWRPDQVVRTTVIGSWRIRTLTVCPPGRPGCLVRIEVTNLSGSSATLDLGLWLSSAVTCQAGPWLRPESPRAPNSLRAEGPLRWGTPQDGSAVCLQTLLDADGHLVDGGSSVVSMIQVHAEVESGQSWLGWYVQLIGESEPVLRNDLAEIAAAPDQAVREGTARWNHELRAMFTPNNGIFSGHLPAFDHPNQDLVRLYWWGALGVLWFRRENPKSLLGPVYDTLMPHMWQTTTFIWDYSLSSWVHAQLDPAVMRRQILYWVGLDINQHFGTEWLTGSPVGYWYSVNQYALVRLVADYIRFTGDLDFLQEVVPGPDGVKVTLGDHVRHWAMAWQDRRTGSGLADYGDINNLLECVSSYTHEVVSLQAANVWCMRTAAELSDMEGNSSTAALLRQEAKALVPRILDLYRPGDGFFDTRYPDESRRAVRHCYDFAMVGINIAEDLTSQQRAEMLAFFDRELRTPSWMHALSPSDSDAGYSLRPDHQWNGAYAAWPAECARAAVALGGAALVRDWIPGLARTTRQGPPGQAHFVEEAADPIGGGARKAPVHSPYSVDWACSSAGAWCQFVVESVVGLTANLDASVRLVGGLRPERDVADVVGFTAAGVEYSLHAGRLSTQGVPVRPSPTTAA